MTDDMVGVPMPLFRIGDATGSSNLNFRIGTRHETKFIYSQRMVE